MRLVTAFHRARRAAADTTDAGVDRWLLRALLASGLALLGSAVCAQEDGRYEIQPPIELDRLLPGALRGSGEHRVTAASYAGNRRIAFDIESQSAGLLRAVSIPLAVLRIHEVQVLAQATEQFARDNEQLADEVRGQIRIGGDSVVDIIGSPLDTSGEVVGQFGRNVGQTLDELGTFPGPAGATGGGRIAARARARGDPIFASHRRSVAGQLGLDVYSSNPAVQRFLDVVAEARVSGRARAGVTTVSIPRRPEVEIDGGRLRERIRSAVLHEEQSRLFERNAQRLEQAGVPRALAERLLAHPVLTPTHKSALTEYLFYLRDVANRAALVESALESKDEVDALAHVQTARAYAHYHETRAPLHALVSGGALTLAIDRNGGLLVVLPFDVLHWDPPSDRMFSGLAEFAERKSATVRVVLLLGAASQGARDALEGRGFEVVERALFKR